jgi:tetratricopeptide (TPR) repeat protein
MRRALLLVVAFSLVPCLFAFPPQPTPLPIPTAMRTTEVDDVQNASIAELERRGDEAQARKAYMSAAEFYQAALDKTRFRPQKVTLCNKLGIAELLMQRYRDAEKDFERAIKYNRKSAQAYNNLGAAYYLQKEYGKSIRQYQKALRLGDEASFHNNLATAYFMRKQLDLAAQEYRRALELDPLVFERSSQTGVSAQLSSPENRAEHNYLLARLFAQVGDFDRSISYLRKAMEDGYSGIGNVYNDAEFSALRRDPRFDDLMKHPPYAIPQ